MLYFMTQFDILTRRLAASWIELMSPPQRNDEFRGRLREENANNRRLFQERRAAYEQLMRDPHAARDLEEPEPPDEIMEDDLAFNQRWYEHLRNEHVACFPFSQNLLALYMMIQAELPERDRERLAQHFVLRGINVQDWTVEIIRAAFRELFVTTRTSVQDPSLRPSDKNRGRQFYIMEPGEYDGFWVEEEETGEEGFCPTEHDDQVWFLDQDDVFTVKRVPGMRAVPRPRGFVSKRRSKGKGRRRGNFRPYRSNRKGGARAHAAQEDYQQQQYPQDALWGKQGKRIWKTKRRQGQIQSSSTRLEQREGQRKRTSRRIQRKGRWQAKRQRICRRAIRTNTSNHAGRAYAGLSRQSMAGSPRCNFVGTEPRPRSMASRSILLGCTRLATAATAEKLVQFAYCRKYGNC